MGTEFQNGMMGKFQRWAVVIDVQQRECHLVPLNCTLKTVKMVNFILHIYFTTIKKLNVISTSDYNSR